MAVTGSRRSPRRSDWHKNEDGLSWQVVPETLVQRQKVGDPAATGRMMMGAPMQVTKLDMAELERAYDGRSGYRHLPEVMMGLAPYLVVLGIAQDGGHPHAGCTRQCCAVAWKDPALRHRVSSLGLVDPATRSWWLLDATPDLPDQLHALQELLPGGKLAGVLPTHAHIGHYTGLMYLGRESIGASQVPVYAMPRMLDYLSKSGPWEMLSRLGNIALMPISDQQETRLSPTLSITPLQVPHRDEYSETVGFIIEGPEHRALYLPDIDKWEKWSTPIETVLAGVDRAWIDATFYADAEIPGRSLKEIPHPFISETIQRFAPLPAAERGKVHFIHLNHTNPAIVAGSEAQQAIGAAGMAVAVEGERFDL